MDIISSHVPTVALNDGTIRPQIGFGVFQIPDEQCVSAIDTALEVGYRSIDTATLYANEHHVGQAIASSEIARNELFVTTKLWISDMADPRTALQMSLDKLRLDYVDSYLIHWPAPATDEYLRVWETMQELRQEGLIRSIGVSNFFPEHLKRLVEQGGAIPAVNQIELHPRMQNKVSVAANQQYTVTTEAWSPLGRGASLDAQAVVETAAAHGVSASQVILRWHLQQGRIITPKSASPTRIAENFDIFNFQLSEEQISAIDQMEQGLRTGPHPQTYNG